MQVIQVMQVMKVMKVMQVMQADNANTAFRGNVVMQVAQPGYLIAGELTQVKEAIPWVRCASGNV